MIGAPLRDEQIDRTLERHHCLEGTEVIGIENEWDGARHIVIVKEPQVGDRRGLLRWLEVPPDVLAMPAPEKERRSLLG